MTKKLHFVSALMVAMAGSQISGSWAVSAEEVGDDTLQSAAYDVIIVPREGRTSRSRIWTDRGWTSLPAQRGSAPYAPRPRASARWADPRADDRTRPWTYGPRAGPYARNDRTRDFAWRNGAAGVQTSPRSTWRPRYAERQH